MNELPSPEERAQKLVELHSNWPGGAWYVRLVELADPPILIGPYDNPELARDEMKRLQQFVAALIRESRPAPSAS